MNGWGVAILVVGFVAVDLLVVGVVVRAAMGVWNALGDKHPPAEPAPDALRKNFQSFKLGLINLGNSVHVAVDPGYLHLSPAKFARLLGARPASIPWDAMTPKKTGGRFTTVRVGMSDLMGPSWCFEMLTAAESDT